jgi:hypothetical protein
MRKLIDLPDSAIKKIKFIAAIEGTTVKQWIEGHILNDINYMYTIAVRMEANEVKKKSKQRR